MVELKLGVLVLVQNGSCSVLFFWCIVPFPCHLVFSFSVVTFSVKAVDSEYALKVAKDSAIVSSMVSPMVLGGSRRSCAKAATTFGTTLVAVATGNYVAWA